MTTTTTIANTNNPLTLNNLDFPLLKESFKNFIKNQTEFKDYDFDGSNISSLLDILAYNTYYTAFYTNVLLTESFLDSAVQRESVISILKPTGFTPKSTSSAKIMATISIQADSADYATQILVPRYSVFMSGEIAFVNLEPFILSRSGPTFSSSSVLLYEGEKIVFRFIVNSANDYFKIPYKTIDTSTLKVRVFQDLSSYEARKDLDDPKLEYLMSNTLYASMTPDAKVYFVQEDPDGNYSIYFGDGILGHAIEPSNIVETTFINSSGSAGNNFSIFTFARTDQGLQTLSGYSSSNISISPVTEDLKSFNGSEKQSIESIRKLGPYHFEAQDRIVTLNDYEYYIKQYFNNIEILKIWGGEDNDPPRYGSVFVMLKLYSSEILSSYQKDLLTRYIKNKSILGLNFVIQDPNVVFIIPSLEIKVDPYNVRDVTLFSNKIYSYLVQYTSSTAFSGTTFRPSDLIFFLKNQESLIKSVNCSVKLQKNVYAIPGSVETKQISFSTSLVPNTLISSLNFTLDPTDSVQDETLTDNGLGAVVYSRTNKISGIKDSMKMGSIDYTTGVISLENFLLISYLDFSSYFSLYCIPKDIDLYVDNFSLFSLNPDTVRLSMIFDSR